jgi:hypothetical protein
MWVPSRAKKVPAEHVPDQHTPAKARADARSAANATISQFNQRLS